ncbi:MAG: ABC transporter, partial [Pontixanthobacter sp.]
RRPQGAALMSPIFGYWGLTQTYDDARADRTTVEWEGLSLPIDLAGAFTITEEGSADCTVSASGVIADCRIGNGRALIVGDAALLDAERDPVVGRVLLDALLDRAFTG